MTIKKLSNAAAVQKHPDHSKSRVRLKRIRGQLDGIERMVDERRYCPEIVFQIRAVTQALKSMESEIMRTHLKGCVRAAFMTKDAFEVDEKIEEVMTLFK